MGNKAKYKIGDRVYYPTNNKTGLVKASWYDGHEYRYEVTQKGQLWSIPQSALLKRKPQKQG